MLHEVLHDGHMQAHCEKTLDFSSVRIACDLGDFKLSGHILSYNMVISSWGKCRRLWLQSNAFECQGDRRWGCGGWCSLPICQNLKSPGKCTEAIPSHTTLYCFDFLSHMHVLSFQMGKTRK